MPNAMRTAWAIAAAVLPVVLAGFAAAGTILIALSLAGWWIVAPLIPAAVYVVWRRLPGVWHLVGLALGALVIPVLALVGFDGLWAVVTDWRPPALVSLVVGGFLVFGAAWLFLQPWWTADIGHPARWAALVTVLLVLAPPIGVGIYNWAHGSTDELGGKTEAVSSLDVIVLRGGTGVPSPGPSQRLGWNVTTYTGRVVIDGEGESSHPRVVWGQTGAPPAISSTHADRVLLIYPDGGLNAAKDEAPPIASDADGEVARWMAIANGVAPKSTPTYALLHSGDHARLLRWRAALSNVRSAESRHGDAQELDPTTLARDTTDQALQLGVLDPHNTSDLALAAQHKPALFFDRDEPDPSPLNIDQLLRSGKLRVCRHGQALSALCSEVHGSDDLDNDGTNLAFDPRDIAGVDADSTIYVHVSRSGNDVPNTIYLDYWWYLPDNPTGAVGGALCGAGFVVAGYTCLDHQSDWEGITVVLDGDHPAGPPIAVSYAEHTGVARYTWRAAQRLWIDPAVRQLAKGIDTTVRPLVFVARGTHASYPMICDKDKCSETGAPDLKIKNPFRENRHNGRGPAWSGNLDEGCRNVCLAALPTRDLGRRRAQWNAFEGRWGSSHCALNLICTSDQPPRSPGAQDRYKRPWCYNRAFDHDGVRYIAKGGACSPPQATADEITRGERLLALGDSYSSGPGGGDYEHGTDGDGNTCFRSANAWPLQFAGRLGLTALHSLACSGATTRLASQVDRIKGNPGMITLTIGRNDVRFAEVLQQCIEHNCVKAFTKPDGGDIVEDRIARLRAKLPGVYRSVAAHAPRARVIVMDYPRLFPTIKATRPAPDCAVLRQITSDEADYLNERITSLDVAISDAAAEAGVGFVDVADAFDGRPLGCRPPSYLNRQSLHLNRLPASFHPNVDGYRRLADVFASRLPPAR
ncbi:MAG TPA: GDSL-type esterase/lipase family protein [Baekduia sp.]|nr:GDSL-type esterase/lipase family protein [Baekduia sp.]